MKRLQIQTFKMAYHLFQTKTLLHHFSSAFCTNPFFPKSDDVVVVRASWRVWRLLSELCVTFTIGAH